MRRSDAPAVAVAARRPPAPPAARARTPPPALRYAIGEPGPIAVAVDDTHVYWANGEDGSLARAPREGGAAECVVKGLGVPGGLVLDGAFARVTVRAAGERWSVVRVPKAGGAVQLLLEGTADRPEIAVEKGFDPAAYTAERPPDGAPVVGDARNVYWVGRGRIARAPRGGGPVTTAVLGDISALAVHAGSIYYADRTTGEVSRTPTSSEALTTIAEVEGAPKVVAADSGLVLWIEEKELSDEYALIGESPSSRQRVSLYRGTGAIWDAALDREHVWIAAGTSLLRVPRSSGTSGSTVAAGLAWNGELAVAPGGDTIFVAHGKAGKRPGRVLRFSSTPGSAPVVVAKSADAQAIAADAGGVVWLESDKKGGVLKSSRSGDGKDTRVLARVPSAAGRFVLDDRFVYLTIPAPGANGSVLKVPREGGEPSVLAADLPDPLEIAFDGGSLLVLVRGGGFGTGALMRVAKEGGAALIKARGGSGLAVGPDHVYWADPVDGTIVRISRSAESGRGRAAD